MNVWTGRNRVGRSAMRTWRAVILAAASAGALAGCGTGGAIAAHSGSSARPSADASSAATTPVASPSKPTAALSATTGTSTAAVLYLAASEQVPFAGDAVTVTAQASAGPAPRGGCGWPA